ncbi:hypothetical protein [Phyllobacterium lublinensis]|uniref:hypothetical protein n=1 Tax=Phyllobacterium lublinensis TaxID=2875708 RepID=UPI001CCA8D29|nr:hypothetical protein [Phyllobacterium sp. 2063]MBZ9654027.1 hypothetical protein [Phyllobacterium sp. 2063]
MDNMDLKDRLLAKVTIGKWDHNRAESVAMRLGLPPLKKFRALDFQAVGRICDAFADSSKVEIPEGLKTPSRPDGPFTSEYLEQAENVRRRRLELSIRLDVARSFDKLWPEVRGGKRVRALEQKLPTQQEKFFSVLGKIYQDFFRLPPGGSKDPLDEHQVPRGPLFVL